MAAQVKVLVGTRKGAFVYSSDERRQSWQQSEPMLEGWQVYHMTADVRGNRPRLYAAANNPWWGRSIARSEDWGKTWEQRTEGLAFPADMGLKIETAWHVRPGHDREPGVVYAGTAPGGLFRSEDWGATWRPVDGINRHPLRPYWSWVPDGLSPLHSIELDPNDPAHMYVAISGGGSYETRDAGASWQMISYHAAKTSRATWQHQEQHPMVASPEARAFVSQHAANVPPDTDPAAVFDMHRMRLDQKDPRRLWAQAHTGVFHSGDGGATWREVTQDLPSFHGFPIAVTRRAPDAVFAVPLQADEFRVCHGQFTVYRTRDTGETWESLTDGLPGPGDYQSVYREGMDTDGLDPEGVYVGTSNGQVFASADGGDHWQRLPGTVPPVLSVTCAAL